MLHCFDIGGSTIKGGIAFAPGNIRPTQRAATPLHDFDAFAAAIGGMMTAHGGGRGDGIALSITGVVDPETRRITCANIPCIDGRVLAEDLGAALDCRVVVANDADCFALAEAGAGAGRGQRVVFGIILGTGVGGGIVIDGRLLTGAGGLAGEWGHGPAAAATAGIPPVSIPRFACGCGQTGCVDTVGGARGLERLHRHLHGQNRSSTAITTAWTTGDAAAARTLDCFIDLLAGPLALAVNILGASILPVGGGLSSVPGLIERLDAAVRTRILRRTERALVVQGQCRIESGLIGAGLLGFGAVAS